MGCTRCVFFDDVAKVCPHKEAIDRFNAMKESSKKHARLKLKY
jgi:hypothetical protein